ncbi:MAG: hypothetical protein ACYS4W_01710 [Planctomycetota bacterium]
MTDCCRWTCEFPSREREKIIGDVAGCRVLRTDFGIAQTIQPLSAVHAISGSAISSRAIVI